MDPFSLHAALRWLLDSVQVKTYDCGIQSTICIDLYGGASKLADVTRRIAKDSREHF